MATAIVRGDKTKFVTEFLTKNPTGNVRTINEAWAAEGMEGKVSKTVVDKTRARLGLTGNLSRSTKNATQAKPSANKTKPATFSPGKTGFTKEFLNDHPDATSREVNEAWTRSGMKGTISHAVVSDTRKSLGLTGRTSNKSQKQPARTTAPTPKPRGRKPASELRASSSEVSTEREETARTAVLMAVEVEIDRLIFQMMGLGDLTEIETALREARRAVYKALTS
jgi:hypothetical protein